MPARKPNREDRKAQMAAARRHLSRRDPVLKRLVAAVGRCTLWHNPDGFATLARSIISQQISSKAAHSIGTRLEQALGPAGLAPGAILAATDETLRAAGLSAAKARSLRDLAEKVHSGLVPLDELPTLADEEVIAHLLPVRGIGRWTAQMFLVFSLGRLDVLPVDDLGLRVGVQRQYGLPELPGKTQLLELAEPWRPYRTVATWYLWRSLGFVPQSD
jgi:DNA-3-methyladenine glycosylase II